jgi:GINS complex subunit 2
MALPTHLQYILHSFLAKCVCRHGLSPAEVTFLGESSRVFIQPRQAMAPLQLIDVNLIFTQELINKSTIPAFKPPQSVEVPLWLALLLKRQRRARIIPPTWLNHDYLQELLEDEEKEDSPFSALPFQWLEISTALLERCRH